MGKLVEEALEYATQSVEARRFLSAGETSFDAKVNMIEDSLFRTELELAGINTDGADPSIIVGDASQDDGSSFQVPDTVHFDQVFRETEYADIDLLSSLQVTSTIPIGALEQKFFIDDFVGEYKRAKATDTDIPLISLKGAPYSLNVEMGHGALAWDQQEMDRATFSGRPLDMMRVKGVRRKYLENIYDLIIYGDDKLKGLTDGSITVSVVIDTVVNPNTVSGAALKYWINKTGREIVKDLIAARIAIATATQSRWGGAVTGLQTGVAGNAAGFTCLLAQSVFYVLLEKYMHSTDGGTNITVWEYLNSENGRLATGITDYKIVHDFDTAFNSKTDAGFMLLPNSPEAYSFEKPLGLTAKPVQFNDLQMKVPYYDYFAGLKLIRDKALIGYRSIAAV